MNRPDTFAIRQALSNRDLAVLEDIRRFRLLSTRQIQRLHFPFPSSHETVVGATRAAHRVLQRLHQQHLVGALHRRVGGPERGSAAALWQLAEGGVRVLELGERAPRRARYREPTSSLFVHHTVAIAELAVGLIERARESGLDVMDLQTEPDSWREYLGGHGQPVSLRPDLYVVLASDEFEQHSFIEVDLGTEHAPQLLRKSLQYAQYAGSGSAEDQLGIVPRTVWVTPSARRRDAIQAIIAADTRLPPMLFGVTTEADALTELTAGLEAEPG